MRELLDMRVPAIDSRQLTATASDYRFNIACSAVFKSEC